MSKVAVIITEHTQTRIPFLIDALVALNSQTHTDFEVFLVDDSPDGVNKDNTIDASKNLILQIPHYIEEHKCFPCVVYHPNYEIEYAKRHFKFAFALTNAIRTGMVEKCRYKLHVLKTPGRLGASAACNVGISAALQVGGFKYIAMHDGDDVSLYDRLRLQVEFLDKNPHLIACGTDKLEFGICHMGRQSKYTPHLEFLRAQAAFFGACLYKTSLMMRATIATQVFDNNYPAVGDDIVMNSRLARLGYVGVIPVPLMYYRRHYNNLSITEAGAKFDADYRRAVKQVLSESIGEVVDDEFLRKFQTLYHEQQAIPDGWNFVDETLKILSKCEYIDPKALKELVENSAACTLGGRK